MKNKAYPSSDKSFLSISKNPRFRKNFLRSVRANTIVQGSVLLLTPLLTRLYSPDDFGVATLFTLVLGALLSFSTYRVDWTIPNTRNDCEEEALSIIGLCFLVLICIALTLLIISNTSASVFSNTWFSTILPYLPLIVIALLGTGLSQVFSGIHIANADTTPISNSIVARTLATATVSVILGIIGAGSFGLIIGKTLGAWAETATIIRKEKIKSFLYRTLSPHEILKAWEKYRRECSLSVLVGIINYGFLTILPLALAAFYSMKEVGYYALAQKVSVVPVSFISKSVAQSFWAESCQLAKENPLLLRKVYKETLLSVGLLSIVPALATLCGPLYFGFFFGKDRWTEAGLVLSAMTPQVVGTLVFGSTNHLTVYGRQGYQLMSDSATIILCLAYLFLAKRLEANFALTVLGISSTVLCGYVARSILHFKANKEHCDVFNSLR